MNYFHPLLCIALGFATCWWLIPIIRRRALIHGDAGRAGQFHHAHKSPVPRLGGIALAAAFAVVAAASLILAPAAGGTWRNCVVTVLGSLAMFGLGLWDDFRSLGGKAKLLGQIAIASGVYFGGIQIELFKNPLTNTPLELGVFGYVATVLWLVTLTNVINLIDGIDGLAGGIGFMLMCLLAHVGMGVDLAFPTLLAAGVAAALLGFLYYNFPPAKIYMGDGGAYLIGSLIGILSILNSHKGSVAAALLAPMFALALPLLDVGLAIGRRVLKGLPIFRPDRKHIHHQLLDFGFSRERAVLVLYMISFFCLFLAFGVFWSQGRLLPLLLGFLVLALVVAGRSCGFIREWFALGTRLAKSLALRRETRYALTLGQWLEMEAERRDSVFGLWQDYQFVVKKLGFSEVKLALPDGTNTWAAAGCDTSQLRRSRHELNGGAVVEFGADATVLPGKLFDLLSELAAETWHKAAARWQELNQLPLAFAAVASPEALMHQRKITRPYAPTDTDWWTRVQRLGLPSASSPT